MTRYGRDFNTVTRAKGFNKPLGWRKKGRAPGGGLLVFVNSWSDFFIEDSDPWRDEAWDVIRRTPQHTYQILTKRPERIRECLPEDWGNGWANVWLGTSVESGRYLDERAWDLTIVPAVVRFLSCEPLLGPLDLMSGPGDELEFPYGWLHAIQWVITGGESDPKAPRPANPVWFRQIRDQCQTAGVAYFHKQNGGSSYCKCHGSWGCRLLDGKEYNEFPEVTYARTQVPAQTSLPGVQ